ERASRLRARAPPLARPQPRIRRRSGRAHAAAAGDRRPAVRRVGEVPSLRLQLHRDALAGDHPELVRRRVLDLPAAPVLPHHSRGVHGRRARGRLRRVPHPAHRRLAPREARDRRRTALLVPVPVQRLLPAAALFGRVAPSLGVVDRALRVPLAPSGAMEPDDGRDAARHGAGDRPLLPRAARVRRGRDADGGERMKLTVIGAGSTYTPELVSHLSRLPVDEVALHDVDAERLEVVGGLAERMLAKQDYDGALVRTGDLDRALDGAAFVLFQIRVGGQQARLRDETVPLRCSCIGQETTGAGGFAKAVRTVPVVLELAERVADRAAPGAWIVDFTNPVGIVTRSLLDAGHRAVGLCNVAIGFQRSFARLLGEPPERVLVDQVGLNHLTWVRAVLLGEEDVPPDLLAEPGEAATGLVASLARDDGALHVVDVRNGGTLAGLADDDVVEVPARVGAAGPEPLPQSPLAPELLGLIQHTAAYERLAAQAAVAGD